jgi:hypothetical protein
MVYEVETTANDGVNGRSRAVHLSKWQSTKILYYTIIQESYVLRHVSTVDYLVFGDKDITDKESFEF